MNDEQELLASAYLDDALTGEERTRAEADPEVMAAVERMAELRRALSIVEPPDPVRRDVAINAALELFEASQAPEVSAADQPRAPSSVTALSTRRSSRWLIPAAAAALVAIVAGSIVASRDGQDDDEAGSAAVTVVGTESAQQAGAEAAADTTAGTTATRAAGEDDAGTAATALAATPSTMAASETADSATTDVAPELRVITSPEELTRLATSTVAVFAGPPPCDAAGRWLERAVVRVGGRDTVVDVFLAQRAGRVRAVDPDTCEVVLAAPAPPP